MIVAGRETTALLLFRAALLLAGAPEWQDRIAAEAPLATDPTAMGASGVGATPSRTRAVVQETRRLFPPAFIPARLAAAGHDIDGVAVRASAIVLLPFWMLHRHALWWSAPARFHPGRFRARPDPERFTFPPFGARPRACIGTPLATAEAVLVLARLLRHRRLERDDAAIVLPIGVLSTRPDRAPGFRLLPA